MKNLGAAGASALKWGVASTAGRFLLQIFAQILLARQLGPENYGLFGIGLIVLTFSTFLTNVGFGWRLLSKQNLTTEDIRFAFTWHVIAGLIAVAIMQLSAGLIATYFKDERVEDIVRWLSLACFLNSITSPATALTQRALRFKQLGMVQIVSYFIGYILVGLPMAYTGHGVYALVSAWITQVLATFIGTYLIEKHSIKPLLHYEDSKSAFNIGATVFFINIINWALTNLDRTVLGRLLNPTAVGNYTLAYNLAVMPSNMLMSSLQPAFTAAGAHLSQQRERLRAAYDQIVGAILVLVLPTFAALAVCAPDLVLVLYGDKWISSGPVLSVLFLAMPLLIVLGVSTPVLANTNKLQQEFWVQVPILCAAIPAFYMLTTSPVSAAIIALLVLLLRSICMVAAALRSLESSSRPMLADLCRGLILSTLTASMAYGIQLVLENWDLPIVDLAFTGFTGLALLSSILVFLPICLGPRAHSMLQRFGVKADTEKTAQPSKQ